MSEILDCARNGDFITAKEHFDKAIAEGSSPSQVLNFRDGRERTVAHYAAEYDDAVVIEWLFKMGADLFLKDSNNKSPIDIAVILDSRLRRKKRGEGDVIRFLKSLVLNPVQQMFFLEGGESTDSVPNPTVLEALSNADLAEVFVDFNRLQAVHLFAMYNRFEESRYLLARGVDMKTLDDDGNSALHFVSSLALASFLVSECGLDINLQNTSDGHTPAHSLIERAAMDDVEEDEAVRIIAFFVEKGADFGLRSESEDLGVAELAIDLIGIGRIVEACLKGKGALGGISIEDYLSTLENFDSEDSISVASHDEKVVREDGEESSDFEDSSDSSEESESDDDEDFFIRPK
jgi:ankyrin repeat protein